MYYLPLFRNAFENVLMAGVTDRYLESAAQTLCAVSASPFLSKCTVSPLPASDLISLIIVEKWTPITENDIKGQ